jgi:hypothetical protein
MYGCSIHQPFRYITLYIRNVMYRPMNRLTSASPRVCSRATPATQWPLLTILNTTLDHHARRSSMRPSRYETRYAPMLLTSAELQKRLIGSLSQQLEGTTMQVVAWRVQLSAC